MNKKRFAVLALLCAFGLTGSWSARVMADAAADAEKEKAMKNPYPNDLGPDKVDVSKYSPELQAGYKLLVDKCARCHSPSRPLNSQFLDLKGPELEAFKKANPDMVKDKAVIHAEDGIWQRYVKRMMAKPGCNIAPEDGKKIWKFIVEHSKREKTGANAAKWAAQRKKFLEEFKTKYPARHKELFESK